MQKGIFDSDENENDVTGLLAGLPKAEAPADFERMVRTRIAEERPSSGFGRPELMLALKFALPTLALLVFGAFLILSGDRSVESSTAAVPPVISDPPAAPLPGDQASPNSESPAGGDNSAMARAVNGQPRANGNQMPRSASSGDPGGGSQDMTLNPEDRVIYPRGLDPTKRISNERPNPPQNRGIAASDFLMMLGVRTSCSPEGGCTAAAVLPNSVAAKAGLKTGDVIEAIDAQPLTPATTVNTAKVLSVSRGGKRHNISLGPK